MKKTNNNSKKLVKVTYEYIGSKFVENPKGLWDSVADNGDIVKGDWCSVWYEGVDEIPEDEVEKYLTLAKKLKTRRNFVVHY